MKKYVVISTNENPEYLFYLPLTIWAWRHLGWEPIVFFSGKKPDLFWLMGKYINDAIHLSTHQVLVEGYGTDTLAQISRLYAACLYGHKEDYLMTSDVDMLPLSDYWQFDPEKITTWGHDLTSFQHYPICYIGMKRPRWVEVMCLTSHRYNDMIKRDLDSMENAKSPDSVKRWVVDQDLITQRINNVNFPKENVPRGSGPNGYPIGRVDRSAWSIEHPQLVDCHMMRGIHSNPDHLAKTMLLLYKAFPKINFTWFTEYTTEYAKQLAKI